MISENHLKLVQSERMTDFPDGGGKTTGNEVIDGELNNVFDDVSNLDRVYGRVSIRKVFAEVRSDNTDPYLGAHAILTDAPDDTDVEVTLFTTESWTDTRDAARNFIESYAIKGPEGPWILYGDHVKNQKQLRLIARSNSRNATTPSNYEPPAVGDVLMLSVESGALNGQNQFVQVSKIVNREIWEFTEGSGSGATTFYRDVLTLELTTALRYDTFPGANTITFATSAAPSATLVRTTSIADAAQYYGVRKLAQAASAGAVTLKVDTPFAALVPAALTETPLVDLPAGSARIAYAKAGTDGNLTASATLGSSTSSTAYADDLYLGQGFYPGTLALTIGATAFRDNGAGALELAGSGTTTYSGTVDYQTGRITINNTQAWSASVSATATLAANVTGLGDSAMFEITSGNQAATWVYTAAPAPSPGSLTVDYMALGKWYRLSDNGDGTITGAAGIGAGTINYTTGSIAVTLGALPDIGSALMIGWAQATTVTVHGGVLTPPAPAVSKTLSLKPVDPTSLTLAWVEGTAKTATCDADGIVSGSGGVTGTLDPQTGKLDIVFPGVPTSGLSITANYQTATTEHVDTLTVTGDAGGVVTFQTSLGSIKPGTFNATFNVEIQGSDQWSSATQTSTAGVKRTKAETIIDKPSAGTGGHGKLAFKKRNGAHSATLVIANSDINYSTGQITVDLTRAYDYQRYIGTQTSSTNEVYITSGEGGTGRAKTSYTPVFVTDFKEATLAANTVLTARYSQTTDTVAAGSDTLTVDNIVLDLAPDTADPLVPGCVRFSYAGDTFFDDGQGKLKRALNVQTGAATDAGTIEYTTGEARLTTWSAGANVISVTGLASIKGSTAIIAGYFRTPSAPITPGQFQVRATAMDGTALTAAADINGTIASARIQGFVDWTHGIVALFFGQLIADANLSAEAKAEGWYDASQVITSGPNIGKIWVPMLVRADSVFYNCVTTSYIPLDADILGVDTVRLPRDGRVPIFRPGNVVVVHNTQTENVGGYNGTTQINLPTAAAKLKLGGAGRTRLAYAKVFDATGAAVPTDRYSTDLDGGLLWFPTVPNLQGLVGQLTVEHRIEDMALLADVQIAGDLSLQRQISHDYPANTSFVSSALIAGDLQARISVFFDQATWANVWNDSQSGSPAGGTYNATTYPVAVSNAGAIQERWALVMTSSATFDCYGETVGRIGQGISIAADYAPTNPNTGRPYFVISRFGWGTGWQSGNAIRFNTKACNFPIWLARTTLMSDPYNATGPTVAAHVSLIFDQQDWYGMWANQRYGGDAGGTFDSATYPIACGAGTTRERWAIVFTSATTFNVLAESIGLVTTGDIALDLAPTNSAAGAPYFTLDHRGWETMTPATGVVLRFNTEPPTSQPIDKFRLQVRGSAN